MFHPLPIPARFRDLFPASLSFRAEQLRAGSEEGVMMSPASQRFSSQYRSISAPVTIVVGDSDKVVNWESQSKALHDAIPGSRFRVFSGVGHMVHYAATSEISASIEEVASRARPLAAA
jgi:pimeloyl-ACP methyl ester carboxylesterase